MKYMVIERFRSGDAVPVYRRVREVHADDVTFGKAQSHIGENVGSSDTYVLIVELK